MHHLVHVVEILRKKLGLPGKFFYKNEFGTRERVKIFKGLTEKSVIFTALATFHDQLSLLFGDVEQQTKLFRLVKRKLSSLKNSGGT